MFAKFKRTDFGPVIAVISVASIYFFLGSSLLTPEGAFAGDAGVKLLQVKALAESGYLDPAIKYPGIKIDPDQAYFPFRQAFSTRFTWGSETQRYGVLSEISALLGAVVYNEAGYWGLEILSTLFGVSALMTVAILSISLRVKGAWAVPLTAGMFTPLMYYSLHFSDHAAATFLSLLSTALMVYGFSLRKRTALVIMAGLTLALSTAFRPELYVMCLVMPIALGLAMRGQKKSAIIVSLFCVGLLFGLLPLGAYNYFRSGSVLGTHVAYGGATSVKNLPWLERIPAQLGVFAQFLAPAGTKKWFLLVVLVGICTLAERYYRKSISSAVIGAAGVWPMIVLLLGYSVISVTHLLGGYVPSTSFFDVSPATILVLLGLLPAMRQIVSVNRAFAFLALVAALFVVLVPAVSPEWGGKGWGPRLLLPAYPIVAILVCHFLFGLKAESLSRLQRISLVTASSLLICLSLTVQVLGLVQEHKERQAIAKILQITRTTTPPVFVTNLGVFSQLVAPIWEEIDVFGVTSVQELTDLVQLLAGNKIRSFWWVSSSFGPWQAWYYGPNPNPIILLEGREVVMERKMELDGLTYTLYRIEAPSMQSPLLSDQ